MTDEELSKIKNDLDVMGTITGRQARLLLTEVERLREALEDVEWFQQKHNFEAQCPWCQNFESEGHKPDCQHQAALGKTALPPTR